MDNFKRKRILIILPHFIGKGGVAQYWRNLKPFYDTSEDFDFDYFEIGGNVADKLHAIKDQYRLKKLLEIKNQMSEISKRRYMWKRISGIYQEHLT